MKNKLVSYLILVYLAITFSFSYANELPIESNVPGGIVIVPIKSKDRPKVFFYDKKVMVVGETEDWKAVIVIPVGSERFDVAAVSRLRHDVLDSRQFLYVTRWLVCPLFLTGFNNTPLWLL